MNEKVKITIEKRIFKVGNNEDFILEYPSNFEEIANRKLNNLQKEYDNAQLNNISKEKDKIDANKKYYMPVGTSPDSMIDTKIEENIEINNNTEKNSIENIIERKVEIVKQSQEKTEDSNDEEEFFEVIEDNKIKNNIIENQKNEREINKIEKREVSPVKDPNRVKLSMKSLKFNPPEWAKNMTDSDFISMAKNFISSGSGFSK